MDVDPYVCGGWLLRDDFKRCDSSLGPPTSIQGGYIGSVFEYRTKVVSFWFTVQAIGGFVAQALI